MALDHVHIVLRADNLARPPRTAEAVEAWLNRLVRAVRMQVLAPARAVRCEEEGNQGVTGTVLLTTSHASLHCWDQVPEPYLQLDVYSCRSFGSGEILRMVQDFGPAHVSWTVLDRGGRVAEVLEIGEYGARERAEDAMDGATAGLLS